MESTQLFSGVPVAPVQCHGEKLAERGSSEMSALEAFEQEQTKPVSFGTVAGRFWLQQEIGEGGMGRVFSAVDIRLHEWVAVKLMGARRSDTRRARFEREGRVALSLQHPNIVRLLEFGVCTTHGPFLVMELLAGETLSRRLAGNRPLAEHEVVAIIGGTLEAIRALHRHGVCHRDLTPDNIVLCREREQVMPKLIDFGLVGDPLEVGQITRSGVSIGTPLYMAPEQIRGERPETTVDFWALGVLAYQLAYGRLPFRARKIGQLHDEQIKRTLEFPSEHPLRAFIEVCLQVEPSMRAEAPRHFPLAA